MSLDTSDLTANIVSYAAIDFMMSGKLISPKEAVEVLIVEVSAKAVQKSALGQKVFGVIPELFPELVSLRELASISAANTLMGAVTDKEASAARLQKIISAKVVSGLLKSAGLDLSTIAT